MNHSILHVITTIDLGGAEKQLLALASHQKKMGYDVEIMYLKGNPMLRDNFLAEGINVNSSLSDLYFFKQIFALGRRRANSNVIFHAHLPRAELLCAIALKTKSFVVTRHNSEDFFPGAPKLVSKILSRFVLRKAFTSISISRAVQNYLSSRGELKNLQNNIVIHYGLLDTSVFVRGSNKIQGNEIQIGTVSRLVPQKNLKLILQALRVLLDSSVGSFQLNIVGVGPLERELRLFANELQLGNSVSWLGQIQNLHNFYGSIDIFVLTSNYEGFGLVLLEAMQSAVPIIARRNSAIPEVLGSDHIGLLDTNDAVELAKMILNICTSPTKLQACLDQQSMRMPFFTIEKTHSAHEKIYVELLKQRRHTTKK